MELGGRQRETVFNIVTMLIGQASYLVEDFSMEQLAAENSFEAVFARLDSGFRMILSLSCPTFSRPSL